MRNEPALTSGYAPSSRSLTTHILHHSLFDHNSRLQNPISRSDGSTYMINSAELRLRAALGDPLIAAATLPLFTEAFRSTSDHRLPKDFARTSGAL